MGIVAKDILTNLNVRFWAILYSESASKDNFFAYCVGNN